MRFFLVVAFSVVVCSPALLWSCSSGSGTGGTGGMGGNAAGGSGGGGGGGTAGSGTAGGGTGGSISTGFPTQACIDRANALLAQMTLDEKATQTIQSERAQTTN